MDNKRFYVILGILIIVLLCVDTSASYWRKPPLDNLQWYTNRVDLIVYGNTSYIEVKWSDIGIKTTSTILVKEVIKQNKSSDIKERPVIPIYIRGGRIDDPAQAAAHGGQHGRSIVQSGVLVLIFQVSFFYIQESVDIISFILKTLIRILKFAGVILQP